MRVAIVDIGTNSTRLLITDVGGARVGEQLERKTQVTRLGAGVDKDGRLAEESMERVYRTLDGYKQLIERHHADKAIAVLTSAVRDAANGKEFADTLRERYGLEPHILTGDEEAELTFKGATSDRDPHDKTPTLVVDIGGGSTEFISGTGHEPSFHVSNQAGVVRQTERHLHSDPPTDEELAALRQDVRKVFEQGVPDEQRHVVKHMIGVAGTATQLAAIDQQLEPYDPDKVQGYVVSEQRAKAILDQLAALPLEQRRQVPGLDPERAPTMVAGILIMLETLRLFGLHELEVSEHDILRGAALGFGSS